LATILQPAAEDEAVDVDVRLIPSFVRDSLADTMLGRVAAFKSRPGGREQLQEKIRDLKAKGVL
jgi:hypothetical protein